MSDVETPVSALKQDPETLVLRARPRPVVRFRRGLIIGAAALMSAGLVGIAWMALEPPSFRNAATPQGEDPLRSASPDALAGAPSNYGEVPELGPPLPGDLGRPILEHRRRTEEEGIGAASSDPSTTRRRDAAEEAEARRLAAREAARSSAVLVPVTGGSRDGAAGPPAGAPGASASVVVSEDERPAVARSSPRAASGALDEPISPWILSAGTIIPASLLTGIDSDLPGMMVAQVTEHVRDTARGSEILVPQGSRLIGSYDSRVAFGQSRALLVWHRIVLPDGSSIRLGDMPATDQAGYAGVEDRVDFHTGRLIRGILVSSLLGVGTELGLGDGENELVRAVREATQQNGARAGERIVERDLDIKPTLRVRPGWPVRAIVHEDLVLKPWRG